MIKYLRKEKYEMDQLSRVSTLKHWLYIIKDNKCLQQKKISSYLLLVLENLLIFPRVDVIWFVKFLLGVNYIQMSKS